MDPWEADAIIKQLETQNQLLKTIAIILGQSKITSTPNEFVTPQQFAIRKAVEDLQQED